MTTLSRRRLLGLGLGAAGAAALAGPIRWLGADTSPASSRGGKELKATTDVAEWRSAIGSEFAVTDSSGQRHSLTLQSVSTLPKDPVLPGEGLLLLFSGALRPMVPPTFSTIEHPTIGSFAAPLLSVDRPLVHQRYQLILDRRHPVTSRR